MCGGTEVGMGVEEAGEEGVIAGWGTERKDQSHRLFTCVDMDRPEKCNSGQKH